jgi:uncharacterized protein (TIGR03118 family)
MCDTTPPQRQTMKNLPLGFFVATLLAACSAPNKGDDTAASADQAFSGNHVRLAEKVVQTNLVSDQDGVAATKDPNAVNVWGIAFNPAGPAWVSNNGTGTTTVYDAAGALKLTVTVPAPAGAPAGTASTPTGQVFNASATDFNGEKFIFATEDGTVSGWKPGPGAVLHVDNSAGGDASAVYKGIGLGPSLLYVANFRAGTVEVYDASYKPVTAAGGFIDSQIPAGYAPFNVFVDGARVFVSYARQDDKKHDDAKGAGRGFVDLFDTDGNLQQRLISRGALNSPWGMAIAPASFGTLAGSLLVGNFGDGHVNAYTLSDDGYGGVSVSFKGALGAATGGPLAIDGLWGLAVSPEADQSRLYFSAGPSGETHGLYGRLELAPPPPSNGGY